jgi:hypothetical protein
MFRRTRSEQGDSKTPQPKPGLQRASRVFSSYDAEDDKMGGTGSDKENASAQPDIIKIAESEEKEGVVDQHAAASASLKKRTARQPTNEGASTTAPAEGPDDLPSHDKRLGAAEASRSERDRSPLNSAGASGGTAGTGGQNKAQDR